MESERNVLDHYQGVSNSNARKEQVDGIFPHTSVGEYENVDDVEKNAKEADCQR